MTNQILYIWRSYFFPSSLLNFSQLFSPSRYSKDLLVFFVCRLVNWDWICTSVCSGPPNLKIPSYFDLHVHYIQYILSFPNLTWILTLLPPYTHSTFRCWVRETSFQHLWVPEISEVKECGFFVFECSADWCNRMTSSICFPSIRQIEEIENFKTRSQTNKETAFSTVWTNGKFLYCLRDMYHFPCLSSVRFFFHVFVVPNTAEVCVSSHTIVLLHFAMSQILYRFIFNLGKFFWRETNQDHLKNPMYNFVSTPRIFCDNCVDKRLVSSGKMRYRWNFWIIIY